jgi:hypothetical protein
MNVSGCPQALARLGPTILTVVSCKRVSYAMPARFVLEIETQTVFEASRQSRLWNCEAYLHMGLSIANGLDQLYCDSASIPGSQGFRAEELGPPILRSPSASSPCADILMACLSLSNPLIYTNGEDIPQEELCSQERISIVDF